MSNGGIVEMGDPLETGNYFPLPFIHEVYETGKKIKSFLFKPAILSLIASANFIKRRAKSIKWKFKFVIRMFQHFSHMGMHMWYIPGMYCREY